MSSTISLTSGNLEKFLIFYLTLIGIAIIGQNIMFEFVLDQASTSSSGGVVNMNMNMNTNKNNNGNIAIPSSNEQDVTTHEQPQQKQRQENIKYESSSYESESDLTTMTSLTDILTQAGVQPTKDVIDKLPPISDVIDMYGSKPVIIGLERCEEFQRTVGNIDAFLGPAGMFNTGTNLLQDLLVKNCHYPEKEKKLGAKRNGIRGQTPWGKHSPVTWRHQNIAKDQVKVNQTSFFPAAIIKDPYTWMDSMCRHKYSANWVHFKDHCPNLVPTTDHETELVKGAETVNVTINYHELNKTHHESLAGVWNDYYGDWIAATFPRLLIRFEDLLFHTKEVVTQVCKCGGAELKSEGPNGNGKGFQYNQKNAKHGSAHKGSNGFVDAITKYADGKKRFVGYKKEDLIYAKKVLRRDMMEMFQYSDPDVSP